MSFLKSFFFCCEGSYNICGIYVTFFKEKPQNFYPEREPDNPTNRISRVCYVCNDVLRVLAQSYSHVLAHEMCHAIGYKLFNINAKIYIVKNPFFAVTLHDGSLFGWKKTIVFAVGSIGKAAFATCKVAAALTIKRFIPWPITCILTFECAHSIMEELIYACESTLRNDSGDFGTIRKEGNLHLAIAGTALVSQCALGIFAMSKLLY